MNQNPFIPYDCLIPFEKEVSPKDYGQYLQNKRSNKKKNRK